MTFGVSGIRTFAPVNHGCFHLGQFSLTDYYLSGVYTMIHVRRTGVRRTMYHSVNVALNVTGLPRRNTVYACAARTTDGRL